MRTLRRAQGHHRHPGFPSEVVGKTFDMAVHLNGLVHHVPARATETVLAAMERVGLAAPSQCRSGECGFCRSLLMAGDVWVEPESDGRRDADRTYGFIHSCSSYPLSDLEPKVPPGA